MTEPRSRVWECPTCRLWNSDGDATCPYCRTAQSRMSGAICGGSPYVLADLTPLEEER